MDKTLAGRLIIVLNPPTNNRNGPPTPQGTLDTGKLRPNLKRVAEQRRSLGPTGRRVTQMPSLNIAASYRGVIGLPEYLY